MSDEDEDLIAGRFQFVDNLGGGGFGEVFQAFDTVLHRHVAVKQLKPEMGLPIEVALTEAQRSARLEHDNIALVFEVYPHVDEDGDQLVLVMQLYTEGTVGKLLERGPLPPTEALRWIDQSLAALAFAHAEGVIHRDVKPSNFLLDRNRTLKLGDFGAAVDFQASDPNALFGISYAYAAPERHVGGMPRDHRMDLWSVGISLFEMLTGVIPFEGHGGAIAHNVVNDEPATIASVTGDDSLDLIEPIVRRLLRVRPDDRYASADEVREAIAPLLDRKWAASTRVPKLKPRRTFRVFWITHESREALERVSRTGLLAASATSSDGRALRDMSRGDVVLHAVDGDLVASGNVAAFPTSTTDTVRVAADAVPLAAPIPITAIPMGSRKEESAKHGGPFTSNGELAPAGVAVVSRAFLADLAIDA